LVNNNNNIFENLVSDPRTD